MSSDQFTSSDLVTLVSTAVEMQQAGQIDPAIELYEQALDIEPSNGAALFGRATCLQLTGRWEEALAGYQAALGAFPDHPSIVGRMAHLHKQLGHLDEAISTYSRALELSSDDPTVAIGMSQALVLLGRDDEALAVLDTVPHGLSSVTDAQRARVLLAMGQFASAEQAARSLPALVPNDQMNRSLLLTDIASARWDFVQAEADIAEACATQPERPALHLRHAARLLALLRPTEAMLALARRAEAVPPRSNTDVRPRATQGLFADIANEFLVDPRSLAAARVALDADNPIEAAHVACQFPGSLAAASALFVTLRRTGRLEQGLPVEGAEIPRHVVQAWLGSPMPAELNSVVATWRRRPGWKYTRFDDRSGLSFMKSEVGDDAALAFRRARLPATRADLLRLAWLAIRGGVWADIDDASRGSLDELVTGRSLIVWQEDRGNIANDFMAAAPGHPAIVAALNEAVQNVLDTYTESTWLATGPGLVTRCVGKWLAANLDAAGSTLVVLDRHELRRVALPGLPMPYKSTPNYWLHAEART
jgi:Flp pilus assembly protein TadD